MKMFSVKMFLLFAVMQLAAVTSVVTCPAVVKNAGVKSVACVHGGHLVDCNQAVAPGTQVALSCTNGYLAGGSLQTSAICLSDGTWSHSDVTCLREVTCPAVVRNEHVQSVTCLHGFQLVDCNQAMAPGTLVVYTCSEGYLSRSSAQATAICLSDGAWSHNDVTCVPVTTTVPRDLPGYHQVQGLANLYKYHGVILSWQDANTSCGSVGAHLVILNSEAEYTAMQDLVTKNEHTVVGITNCSDNGCTWVGVKESDTEQNEFYTALGQPLSVTGFSRWATRQPNDGTLGDGVTIHPRGSGLSDVPATSSMKFAYICELEV